MECEFPTVNSNKDEIKKILESTKTIAIIGLSPDESKDSNRVARYLQSAGYKIIPVYPKEDTILGETVYRTLADIPSNVDLVNIFRKPEFVEVVVDEAIKRGDVKTIWTQKGIVNNNAAQRAIETGMQVVQNHCTMVEHRQLFV
ncbi:CoA-binding protein [Arcobacter sp. FWKO B]|uniref:CoA-binding protein n=1 Tax=Arcobacter sp. FWKO B TaxID=2593672 RepID=UPI0018A622D4|nr:CoA-binding protein [Arcobacter sp. FWKO B]QOG12653.1 CoA-binding protein [Arcobacter sp. FWKO B]